MPTSQKGSAKPRQTVQGHKLEVPRGVKLLRTLAGHESGIVSLAFDPTGWTLASGSVDATVKLWQPASGKLLCTLLGHDGLVYSVAFDPTGQTLASGSEDKTVKLWKRASGKLLHTLEGHANWVRSVAFDATGQALASGSDDKTVKLWEPASGKLLFTLGGHWDPVLSVVFDATGQTLASGSRDNTVNLWERASGRLLRTLEGHKSSVYSVAFDPTGPMLASGSADKTVKLWEAETGKLLRTLEGHTDMIDAVVFSANGQLLASKSVDGSVRVWSCDTWETVAVIPVPTDPGQWITAVAFHPTLPLLATVGSEPDVPRKAMCRLIHFWELDLDVLLSKPPGAKPLARAVHHATAKIVLVGDSGVGKTGLGWRLASGEFKEHASTHGQQFWVLNQLSARRRDGAACEAILWDLAGQPDYRLIHALFLDDADLALVLFDPTDTRDPLHGVEYWLKQIKGYPTILVGARADRGTATLTSEELEAFCRQRGISGYLTTSAKDGEGLVALIKRMKVLVPWEEKPATVTTTTFKRIKDYVLALKENQAEKKEKQLIVSPQELRRQMESAWTTHVQPDSPAPSFWKRFLRGSNRHASGEVESWQFTDAEIMTAVGHLENYGYVKRLRVSKGETRILLTPELLNNLASSFVLEARRNPKGLGSLEETRLRDGEYLFRELEHLSQSECDILIDSVVLLFLEHHVCFRETDPLTCRSYLVFPELINLKKPLLDDEEPTEDGVAYTVSGAVENVFASLVVLLGYTETFTRTDQWRDQARYEVGHKLVCGFRQEAERDGELDFVLYFGPTVGQPVRTLFQGLFESFLARRNLTVLRYEPVRCSKGHELNRAVVRELLQHSETSAFCSKCGEKLALPKMVEPIQLTREVQAEVETQQRVADQRTRFEQAIFRVQTYVAEQKIKPPECFVSYAWGDSQHERWVEKKLATDLQKAGIVVVLDRWENDRAGKSVSRFVSRIADCRIVIPVGTPLYFDKFKNKVSSTGSVVASEVDLISQRLMGSEAEKETVMPVLRDGEKKTSLSPLMWDRVHRDFRDERTYFTTAFDLILDLYDIAHKHPAVADLRESLGETEMR